MAEECKISIKRLFFNSFRYCVRHWHEMSLFAIANAILTLIGFKWIGGWQDKKFLLWLIPYYMFWYSFYRFYFGRRPYMMTLKVFNTLLPSARVLGLTLLFLTILIFLPLVIPFICTNATWMERYLYHLQQYTEDTQVLNAVTMLILTLFSPLILYRPMMAWIGAVIGRSSLLATAFARTKGNYWEFLLITIVHSLLYMVIQSVDNYLALGGLLMIVLGSPLTVFFNVIIAKTYEYFFLEIDK